MREWISLLMALLLLAAVPGALAGAAVPFIREQQGCATPVGPAQPGGTQPYPNR